MTTTETPGRHRRTPTTGHVPTDRTHANHSDKPLTHMATWSNSMGLVIGLLPCAACDPKGYATFAAKHRSDRGASS